MVSFRFTWPYTVLCKSIIELGRVNELKFLMHVMGSSKPQFFCSCVIFFVHFFCMIQKLYFWIWMHNFLCFWTSLWYHKAFNLTFKKLKSFLTYCKISPSLKYFIITAVLWFVSIYFYYLAASFIQILLSYKSCK